MQNKNVDKKKLEEDKRRTTSAMKKIEAILIEADCSLLPVTQIVGNQVVQDIKVVVNAEEKPESKIIVPGENKIIKPE